MEERRTEHTHRAPVINKLFEIQISWMFRINKIYRGISSKINALNIFLFTEK